jgi:hypothetical protein
MIFHGRINSVDKITTKGKDPIDLYKIGMADCSKPMDLRTTGLFTTFLTEDKRKVLPSGDDIDGVEVTISISEMKASDGGINLKGQVVPGIVTADKLVNKGMPQKPEKPVK